MSYTFPPSLELLGLFLRQHGVDVDNLRSDRHALDLVLHKGRIRKKIQFPAKGKPCYNALRQAHGILFPLVPLKQAPRKDRKSDRRHYRKGVGTVGPASKCRTPPPEVWREIAARL